MRYTYAAAAPRISCLLAFVKRASTAENNSVATSKIPTQMALPVFGFIVSNAALTWYNTRTGSIKSARIIVNINTLTRRSTRDFVKYRILGSSDFSAVSYAFR
jgi:hypothetical protein